MIDKKFSPFLIEDIFDVFTGNLMDRNLLVSGEIPRISAKANNNGIQDLTEISNEKFRTLKNSISISFLGDIFYHPYLFSLDMKIHGIKPKSLKLNKNIAFFLITMLKQNLTNYNYGNQLSSNDLRKKHIMLPIDESDSPDWKFMEEYSKNIENQIKSKIKLPKLHKLSDFPELHEIEWGLFFLNDLFPLIQRGKRLIKSNQIKGKTPYISSTMLNNGNDGFIGNREKIRFFENCLTIANSGSVGSVFYHEYKFIASDHVTALKNPKLNKYHYQFIASSMNRIKEKYSFNREINDLRISKERIILPIKNNQPDYDYMEQYMKKLENNLITKIQDKFK